LLRKEQGRQGNEMARFFSAAMTVSVSCLACVAASFDDAVQKPAGSDVATAATSTMDARALKTRGEQLRRELTTVYKQLNSHSREIYYSSIQVELYQDAIDQRDRVARVRSQVVMPSS
jgi:hypothetical protein